MTRAAGLATVAGLALVVFVWLGPPPPAQAHPSDFETLTLDLLVGPEGLETIDAAVVDSQGPGYEAPDPAVRQQVAVRVLDILGHATEEADIDAETSDRYHWVGFLIDLSESSLADREPLQIDTRPLQQLAAELELAHVKVSVCGVADQDQRPDSEALADLDFEATVQGRHPTGRDRPECKVWALRPGDDPVSIAVNPQRAAPTEPTTPLWAVIAGLVLVVGAGLVTVAARAQRQETPSA